ncbi:hypothetical protein N7510_000950 [Penicillium lagena]|uniref:uncharacterized protein n=1 Tax=Penicillium lagena TaxID=94218 RepID=UPI002541CE3D|nr:uncharacterized protein N7510_000950 [Penicillium lagena]KAJ5624641.1 hypothetical protein N7510_000950 [Penicillium lagena]
MAEAALGVAGSVVGVLSLAGQICNCIQKLYAFLDSVSHAECDVQSLRTELLLFETIIQSIREDYSNFSEFIDTKHLNASLKLCHSRIRRLAFSIIPRTASRKGSRGLKSSINLAFRRQSIANYVKDFDSAKLTLILAYQQYAL